ncbi:MAG: polyketide synthase, partial [Planctomycetaceae bacterium]
AALAFAAISPGSFARAAGRLLLLTDTPWPRKASLSMVGIELPAVSADENNAAPAKLVPFSDRVARLPQGSSGILRIAAQADGAVVPDVCTVYYTSDDGTRGQANMRRVGRVVDGQQSFVLDGPPLAGLSESSWLHVRGLDARLDDYRVEAVPPPAIAQMNVVETDPAYLKPADAAAPTTRRSPYQSGLRVREGATVRLIGSSTTPLGNVDVRLVRGNEPTANATAILSEDAMGFTIAIDNMREPATVVVVPEDQTGITAQLPYRYFLGVVIDNAPELEMRMRGIGTAVTPIAKIPIEGSATDDYGIDKAALELAVVSAPPPDDATVEPQEGGVAKLEQPAPGTLATQAIEPDRDGDFSLTLDLKAMSEEKRLTVPDPQSAGEGAAIHLFGEVSDRYDLEGQHLTKSELYRLEIVTAEKLLMLLERRELALRARLEQAIDETRALRDSLDGLRRELSQPSTATDAASNVAQNDAAGDVDRGQQIFRLRAQQNGLQASKTSEELNGIAASLDDLLEEMQNNRVDSVDRSERIGQGVRDPLRAIVNGDLARLRQEISDAESLAADPGGAAEKTGQAVQTAEDVLLQLTAVLEKMLDLESYNEILDMLRELIDNQDGLLEETKKEQKRKLQDLFK